MSIDGGITEHDLANYLANTPGFFERHAELLASIQLTSPHGTRAVSLQERQMEMLREKIRGLEQRIIEMIRHGQDNMAIADRLHRFTRSVMLVRYAGNVPDVLLGTLKHEFMIPHAGLRLWGLDEAHAQAAFTQPVDADLEALAAELDRPYCGAAGASALATRALGCLPDDAVVQSMAVLPLRTGVDLGSVAADADDAAGRCFGLLVLASPDPTRYVADMGTDFLARVADVAAAALARMLPMR